MYKRQVAQLAELPFDAAPVRKAVDLATVGRINDLAYGAEHAGAAASVAMAFDVGDDTAVWFVATLPHARRNGLAARILQRLLLDARAREQRTASLQASQAGRPLYERLGFAAVGTLHLYEQPLGPA